MNWNEMMDEYDLVFYAEYQKTSKSDLEQMREEWKALRRFAIYQLNLNLQENGRTGQIMSIDTSDDELYSHIDDESKQFLFFKYSRILDFNDGYKPKNMIIICKKS